MISSEEKKQLSMIAILHTRYREEVASLEKDFVEQQKRHKHEVAKRNIDDTVAVLMITQNFTYLDKFIYQSLGRQTDLEVLKHLAARTYECRGLVHNHAKIVEELIGRTKELRESHRAYLLDGLDENDTSGTAMAIREGWKLSTYIANIEKIA